ncbi:MAG: HEAT repeat domain-containing protein, partial [Bacteroidota bacterium]
MKSRLCWIVPLLFLFACVPVTKEEEITEVNFSWKNADLRSLSEFQDAGQIDSLYKFFSHRDPTVRVSVANAFASIRSTQGLDSLYMLLSDNIPAVREGAAYAIGQIGDPGSENILLSHINSDSSTTQLLNARIFEAIGKLGSKDNLIAMAAAPLYNYTEEVEMLGLVRAIYQYALRDITIPQGTDKMVNILSDENYSKAIRVMAANYIGRSRNIDLNNHIASLSQVFSKTKEPFIKTALALGLGRTKNNEAANFLINSFEVEEDYRVKANILRALNNFPIQLVNNTINTALKDSNVHVANLAAEYLIRNGRTANANSYRNTARSASSWPLKARMYEAANTHLTNAYRITKTNANKEIKELFEEAENRYEKAAYLKALGPEFSNIDYIKTNGLESSDRLLQLTAARIFMSHFSERKLSPRRKLGRDLIEILKKTIDKNDPVLIAELSPFFVDPDLEIIPKGG